MDMKQYQEFSDRETDKFIKDLHLLMLRFKSEVIDLNPSTPIDYFGFGQFLAESGVSEIGVDSCMFFDYLAKELGIDPESTGCEKFLDDLRDKL